MDDADKKLLEAMKAMLMQTKDDIRREIVSQMGDHSERAVIFKWMDIACGDYSYHVIPK